MGNHPFFHFYFCISHCVAAPPGLEPGLFWSRVRRVASYTTGQIFLHTVSCQSQFNTSQRAKWSYLVCWIEDPADVRWDYTTVKSPLPPINPTSFFPGDNLEVISRRDNLDKKRKISNENFSREILTHGFRWKAIYVPLTHWLVITLDNPMTSPWL